MAAEAETVTLVLDEIRPVYRLINLRPPALLGRSLVGSQKSVVSNWCVTMPYIPPPRPPSIPRPAPVFRPPTGPNVAFQQQQRLQQQQRFQQHLRFQQQQQQRSVRYSLKVPHYHGVHLIRSTATKYASNSSRHPPPSPTQTHIGIARLCWGFFYLMLTPPLHNVMLTPPLQNWKQNCSWMALTCTC